MENTKQSKKLIINFPPEIHAHVKAHAAIRGISMNEWILRALQEKMAKEKEYLKET